MFNCENINVEALLYTILSKKEVSVDVALKKYKIQPVSDCKNKQAKKVIFSEKELNHIYNLHLNGESNKIIAEKFGITEGAVRGKLYRYKKKLGAI